MLILICIDYVYHIKKYCNIYMYQSVQVVVTSFTLLAQYFSIIDIY